VVPTTQLFAEPAASVTVEVAVDTTRGGVYASCDTAALSIDKRDWKCKRHLGSLVLACSRCA
jgi:hypothetical protein